MIILMPIVVTLLIAFGAILGTLFFYFLGKKISVVFNFIGAISNGLALIKITLFAFSIKYSDLNSFDSAKSSFTLVLIVCSVLLGLTFLGGSLFLGFKGTKKD